MSWFLKQERLDREMAPVVGRCECCGAEFYSLYEAEIHDSLCDECWRATRDLDEDGGEITSGNFKTAQHDTE